MKLKNLFLITLSAVVFFTACEGVKKEEAIIPDSVTLSSSNDSASYAWGADIAKSLAANGFPNLDAKAFTEAAKMSNDSGSLKLSHTAADFYLRNARPGTHTPDPNAELDTMSYAWGLRIGNFFTQKEIDNIDYGILGYAFMLGMTNQPSLLTEEEAQQVMMNAQEEMRRKEDEKNKVFAEPQLKEAEAFLAENGKKEGIVTLPSGMQYKIDKEGNGEKAERGQTVVAHYHGTLIDGTIFDSSVDRGQPFEFQLGIGQVIKGWDQAFSLMSVGSKWTLYVPANLAYGNGKQRPGSPIKPGSLLIFEVEMLGIK